MLIVNDAAGLIEFAKQAFGAVVTERHDGPDGKVMHAAIRIGNSHIMLGEASEKWPAIPAMLYLYVEDVDSMYNSAVKAGGVSLREPTTEFYGDRSSGVKDNFGNQWWMATHVEDVSPEEMQRRQEEMMKGQAQ